MGTSVEVVLKEFEKLEKSKELGKLSPVVKRENDRKLWLEWISQYRERLMKEVTFPKNPTPIITTTTTTTETHITNEEVKERPNTYESVSKNRVTLMNSNNPKIVLRNHICQTAIERAEKGDFSEVQRVLKAFSDPYSDNPEYEEYANAPPDWAGDLCVTCSS